MRILPVLVLLTAATAATGLGQSGTARLQSPDGRIKITFHTVLKDRPSPSGGQLVYSVSFRGKPLIEDSAMSLELEGQPPLGANVRLTGATPSTHDDAYRLITGKASSVRDHYNALHMEFEDAGRLGRKLDIEARAYDDAVAFRYVLPDQRSFRIYRLRQEHTEFRVAKDATTYSLVLPSYRTMYESEYLKLPISALANRDDPHAAPLIGLPLLMHVPGVAWMAITEADMRGNAAMYLVNPNTGWSGHSLESRISPNIKEPDICVTGTLPHHTPWRVLLVGAEPGRLVESNVITSLNPPSKIADTSWIHAGKSSWDWWSGSIGRDGKHAFTTENMKYYVDFSAKSHFPYMLVDAGWSAHNDITKMNGTVDIPALVQYAKPKGVKIWIWCHWTGIDAQMQEAFPLYEKWGVAGVKIDFMSRDDQDMIEFYYRVAENAARHHLMVDFHGATKPTGISRTWPNVLGYEGVLGMEQNKGGMRDNPDHEVTLPFTRMLAGRMDYTPGGFDNVTEAEFVPRSQHPMVMGTRAHQLAMYAVYEAPFQMVSDHPSAYEDQPAFEFIRDVPATWDETRVLNGEPGEFVTVARRRGHEWFLGSMAGWTPRQLDLSLSFLGPGRYRAEIYADADDAAQYPKNVRVFKREVDASSHLTAKLAPGGGYAVRLVPLQP